MGSIEERFQKRAFILLIYGLAHDDAKRTRAGLKAARVQGRIGGRPSKLTNQQCLDIADNIFSGRKPRADMARLYNVSETTVSRIVRKINLPDNQQVISN